MYYVPDLLSINKKGKLAECWLAAILSEQMLKKKISNKKILELDITVACEEILKVLRENSRNPQKRFSLHVAATLMFGVVKIHLYKVDLTEKSLSIILHDAPPAAPDVGGAQKKKITCTDPVLSIDLHTDLTSDLTILEPPPFDIDNLIVAEDVNLLRELSPRYHRENREAEIQSPTHFGSLTGEEIDVWLTILEGDDIFEQGDSEHRPASPPPPLDDVLVRPAPDAPASLDASSIVERVGRKRCSTGDNQETSTKRPRLVDFQPVAGRETEAPSAVLQSIHEKSDQPNLPSIHEESDEPIPAPAVAILAPAVTISPPADSPTPSVQEAAVSHVPADFNVPRQDKKASRKPRTGRVDKNTTIAEAVRRRYFTDREAHTVPSSTVIGIARRELPLSAMLQYPSKTFKFGTNRPPSVRQRLFAVDLIFRFETAISGPNNTTSDYSKILDHIRKKHATIEQMSSRLGNKTGTEVSGKDNTTPEAVDSVAARPVDDAQAGIMNEPGLDANSEAPLPLVEVTDERIPENISEPQVAISVEQSAAIQNENGEAIDRFQESPRGTRDPDALLPQLLREKDKATTTTSHDEPIPVANVEIAGSPSSATQSEEPGLKWTKENLMECLTAQWRDCSAVPFKTLNPPGEKKINSAACFSFLLELSKEKEVYLEQREQIYIEKGLSDNGHENV